MIRLTCLLLASLVSYSLCLSQILPPVHHIYFEANQTTLSGQNQLLLDRIYEKTPAGNKVRIEVYGDVDLDKGMSYYNEIDRARAQAIADYLKAKGIQYSIEIAERTESWTRANYDNTLIREQRNFSEVVMIKSLLSMNSNPEKLHALIKKSPEIRYIDYASSATLNFSGGIEIEIPALAFKCASGSPEGKIKLEVTIYQSNADIVIKDLVTTSGTKQLQSGGMLYIKAGCKTCPGNDVALAAPITISFPTNDHQTGMQYFRGLENKEGEVSWNPTNSFDQNQYADVETELNEESNVLFDGETDSVYYSEENNKMDSYLLEVSSLGWINCDRFYDEPLKQNILVSTDTSIRPYVRIIFPDIKSVMSAYPDRNGMYQFANIPSGRKAVLIAYSVIDKKAYFMKKDIIVGRKDTEEIIPQEMPISKVKELLAQLN